MTTLTPHSTPPQLEQAQDATEKRKQLEIEKEVTPDLIEKYKAHVEKEQRIADATADLRRTYYCEPCDKQYRTYSEFDNHLNSYDHHHRQVGVVIRCGHHTTIIPPLPSPPEVERTVSTGAKQEVWYVGVMCGV